MLLLPNSQNANYAHLVGNFLFSKTFTNFCSGVSLKNHFAVTAKSSYSRKSLAGNGFHRIWRAFSSLIL